MAKRAAGSRHPDSRSVARERVLLVGRDASAAPYGMWAKGAGMGTEAAARHSPLGARAEGWMAGSGSDLDPDPVTGNAAEVAAPHARRGPMGGAGRRWREDGARGEVARRERNRVCNRNFRERQKQKIAMLESLTTQMRNTVEDLKMRNEVLKKENNLLREYTGLGQLQQGASPGRLPASTYEKLLDELLN